MADIIQQYSLITVKANNIKTLQKLLIRHKKPFKEYLCFTHDQHQVGLYRFKE